MILCTNFVLVYVLAVRYIGSYICSHTYLSKMHKCELLASFMYIYM